MTLEERVTRIERILNLGQENEGTDAESAIRTILLDLGAPDHLLGHEYTVEAVLLCLGDRTYANNIMTLYTKVADKFGTTALRVERAVRNLIEVSFERADHDMIYRYFGNTISQIRGKPSNCEFLTRITNVVRQRMKANP